MNQFIFILKDNTKKAFNSFFWFLYFFHLTATAVIAVNSNVPQQKNHAITTFIFFLVITAGFYLFKNKFRLSNYQFLMFGIMILFWVLQSAWLPACIVTAIIIFSFVVGKAKSTALFTGENITITKSVFKKSYQWGEIENVILKDGLLSVDFKSNHLMQVELTEESAAAGEAAFNSFCRERLKV